MKKIITTTLILSLLASVVTAPFASAVTTATTTTTTGQALEIAPPVVNLKADPGQVIDTQISLRDISPTSLVVTGTVDDFTANGDDGVPKILLDQTEPTPYSIKTWIAPLNKLTLKSKEIQNLPVKITVPTDASPGGYYGVIRFTATAPDLQESGVSLSASLGALIFIRVNGDAKEALSIDSFYTSTDGEHNQSLFESAPVTFTAKVKDTGNVFERPSGQIAVTDMFGNAIANINVNLDQRAILPGTTRKFDQDLDKTNIGNRFMFGLYNAKIKLSYGTNQSVESSLSFWVIPWKLILLVLVALIVLIVGGRLLIRRYTERVVGRSRTSRRR